MSSSVIEMHVHLIKLKVQKVKFALGVEVLIYSFFNLCEKWVWVVNVTPRPLYSRKKDTVTLIQETGWAPGPVWTDAEKSRPNRNSIPGPPSP